MAPPLLTLRNIHLGFGGAPLIEDGQLAVSAGERLCLVGRNGSGKSTLLKIAAGLLEADRGERFVQPGAAIRTLPQEPDFTGHETVLAYVEAGFEPGGDAYRARDLLAQVGLDGDGDPARLSGGEAQRAALARVLAPAPEILLLDEPTNHLDLPAIEWLEETLRASAAALVLISHDRRFLENLSQSVIWLDRGVIRRMDGNFSRFEAWRDETLEAEITDRHKLDRKIAMENDWLRYGVTARRKRNQGRLRALQALRAEKRDYRPPPGAVKMTVTEGAVAGKLAIEAKGITKAYGDNVVVKDFSLRIGRRARIGVVGANGAGKTTLLDMLTGEAAPDSGQVRLGANLQILSLDQRRDSLDPAWTLTQALTGGDTAGGESDTVFVQGKPRNVIAYMKDFLFTANQARTPIGALSGGERGRLMLARALARPSNLLALDEPTNDLDLETLDLLQEMLGDYSGAVILVSHDRDFIDRVATSVVVAEGGGRWIDYAGGYSDMLRQRRDRDKPAAKASKAKVKARPAKAKSNFSFKDSHRLKSLAARMDVLHRDMASLRERLDDADLYGRDPAGFEKLSKALQDAEDECAAAEEDWLELEMRREAAEGAENS